MARRNQDILDEEDGILSWDRPVEKIVIQPIGMGMESVKPAPALSSKATEGTTEELQITTKPIKRGENASKKPGTEKVVRHRSSNEAG